MQNFPRISIITPTYNQGEYIERTIQSVLSQNYPNLEYIIIDGGSKDSTVDIIKKYAAHLTYWVSEPDKGQSDAINKGIKHATGDIINWLNSDDWLEAGTLAEVATLFQNSNADVVCGFANLVYPARTILKRTSGAENGIARMIAAGHIMQPTTFFRKKIFDELTPVETSLHYMMDHYMWLKYVCRYGITKVKYTDKVFANVLMHEDAKSVGSIEYFRHDRERIYQSLFHAMQINYGGKKIPDNELLYFPESAAAIRNEAESIRFILLYEQLFRRNHLGEREKIDIKVLAKLALNYPLRFMRTIFQKMFS
jgi:glycosyltransferase involved in cell wall biosynthesis